MANLDVQTALQIGDGKTDKMILSVIEGKVFKILSSKTLGIHITARAASGTEAFVPGGTVLYRKPKLFKVTNYDATGANKQTGQVETISVKLDTIKSLSYEIESTDLARMSSTLDGEDLANAIVGQFAEGSIKSIVAYLDALWLNTAITSASATPAYVTTFATFDGTVPSVKTRDIAYSEVYGTVSQTFLDLITTINSGTIGIDREDIIGVVHPAVKTAAIGGVGAYGSDQTRQDLIRNRLGDSLANAGDGVSIVGEIPLYGTVLLNQNTASLGNFIDGTTWDFSKVAGVIVHREAIALPMTAMQSFVNPNYNNGNQVIVHKFSVGTGVIRPEMIRVLKFFTKTPPSSN